jgi:membrane protein YdbS with pleckstrin-like domain
MADIFNASKSQPAAPVASVAPKERLSVSQLRQAIGQKGRDSLLTSFTTFPTKVCFETQEDEEAVILFLRQHPIVTVPWVILSLFMLTIPSVFIFFPPYAALPMNYQFIVTAGWYLFVFGYALSRFMSWFFNIYIVTDERVVDVDFENILFRKISTAKIEEIQDINTIASGALETFFNYGSIFIQTAAEVSEFDFLAIPKPDQVGKILNQMIDQEEQEKIEGRVK